MDYVALDFETAATCRDSACSIGLVKFDGEGNELDSFYSLICPRRIDNFSYRCFSVHHLDPFEIIKAPTFKELWPGIEDFIGDSMLVAHNAPFDIGVLKGTLESWHLDIPGNDYCCTLSLSKRLMPYRSSHRLSSIVDDMGWTYDAHMALDDARMCGRLFALLCSGHLFEEDDFSSFMKKTYRGSSSPYPKKI